MRASIVIPILFFGLIGLLAVTGCRNSPVPVDSEIAVSLAAETEAMGLIPTSKAAQHMGEEVTVRGTVKDYQWISGKVGKPTLLLFDQSAKVERGSSISDQEIPQTFTVVVWKEDTKKWPPAVSFGAVFDNKTVCATGVIEDYEGSPAIVAREPSQLTIDC